MKYHEGERRKLGVGSSVILWKADKLLDSPFHICRGTRERVGIRAKHLASSRHIAAAAAASSTNRTEATRMRTSITVT